MKNGAALIMTDLKNGVTRTMRGCLLVMGDATCMLGTRASYEHHSDVILCVYSILISYR